MRTTINYQVWTHARERIAQQKRQVVTFFFVSDPSSSFSLRPQYRYGTSTSAAFRHLYREGGVRRFYRGVGPALLQAPLSRFGDTAANAGVLALLQEYEATRGAPMWLKTLAASMAAGGFRILLMPVDTMKTVMQVEGAAGMAVLKNKLATSGPRVLYAGSLGAASATLVGHYPWCEPPFPPARWLTLTRIFARPQVLCV